MLRNWSTAGLSALSLSNGATNSSSTNSSSTTSSSTTSSSTMVSSTMSSSTSRSFKLGSPQAMATRARRLRQAALSRYFVMGCSPGWGVVGGSYPPFTSPT
ncbi:MAG: hypothetical protein E4H00_05635 [Myxococcales bacterium]|nr:MAG: hypothetical protein E4H00_05635 [Myxococcales bacterium]